MDHLTPEQPSKNEGKCCCFINFIMVQTLVMFLPRSSPIGPNVSHAHRMPIGPSCCKLKTNAPAPCGDRNLLPAEFFAMKINPCKSDGPLKIDSSWNC